MADIEVLKPAALTAALVTHAGESIGVVVHGDVAATARPPDYAVIHWYGTVEPTNALDNDIWYDTTP